MFRHSYTQFNVHYGDYSSQFVVFLLIIIIIIITHYMRLYALFFFVLFCFLIIIISFAHRYFCLTTILKENHSPRFYQLSLLKV